MFRRFYVLMDKAGDGGSGGGGGGAGGQGGGQGSGQGQGQGGQQGGGQGQGQGQTITMSKEQFDAIMARLPKAEGGGQGAGGQGSQGQGQGEGDLADKARKEKEAKDKKDAESKSLSTAIKFNMGAKDWAKNNASLLPKTIPGILEAAEKENYGSETEKANAIKVNLLMEFFAVQTNVDFLTESQKTRLEDFKKLTKNDKHERVQQIYDDLFEPTFERLKDVTKARQLSMGHGTQTDAEAAYREKMIKGARKHYLGEKDNA